MAASKWKTVALAIIILAFIDGVINMPKEPTPLEERDLTDSPQQTLEKVISDHISAVGKDKESLVGELHMGDAILQKRQAEWVYGNEKMGESAIRGDKYRWTDAIIPYVIDCSLENLPDAIRTINASIKEWESKTCIRFVKRTNQKKYLKFFRSSSCWAHVGMIEGSSLSVGYGCEYNYVMAHELGHVIGFYHEHNRQDRDNYVEVLWDNIGGYTSPFEKTKNGEYHGTPYDYASIMHYPWNAFTMVAGKDTLRPLSRSRVATPYVAVSRLDVIQTEKMYNCPAIRQKRKEQLRKVNQQIRMAQFAPAVFRPSSSEVLEGLMSDNQIGQMMAVTAANVAPVGTEGCVDWNKACPEWKKDGHCEATDIVQEYCKKTCNRPVCKSAVHNACPKGDTWPMCKAFAADQLCCKAKYKAFMKENCCVSCFGATLPTAPPTTTTTPVTTTLTTTTEATPTPTPKTREFLGTGRLCLDVKEDCKRWADEGACTNEHAGYMAKYCSMSCNGKSKVACDVPGLKPAGVCANPLGLSSDGTGVFKIKDEAFSPLRGEFKPGRGWIATASNARLYFTDDYKNKRIGAWCSPTSSVTEDNLQGVTVDLGEKKRITYIATQGRDKYFERISQFKVEYSDDGRTFKRYMENGEEKLFQGNCDHVTPVLNHFAHPLVARYFRYIPWKWNYPCVRMELYGCAPNEAQPPPIAAAPMMAPSPLMSMCGEVRKIVKCKNKRRGSFCPEKKSMCSGISAGWTDYMKKYCRKTCGYC